MKSISTLRALAAPAVFTTLLSACASMSGGGTSQGGTGAQGETGAAPTRAQCAQFHQMESRHTPTTQEELVDPQLRGMSPDQREAYMNMMREKCGPSVTPRY